MITKYEQFILESSTPTNTKVDKDEVLMKFISTTASENYTFLHVTKEEEISTSIMSGGFRFEIFQKTVDFIPTNDMITLKYVRYQREAYGDYVIVIQIDKNLTNSIHNDFEQISTKTDDEVYILPKEYIKGYFINSQMKFVDNPHFNPKFIK